VSEPPSSTTPPPVATGRVAAARARLIGAEDAQRLASLLNLFADPLQARILYALDTVDERSVGDLAPVLQASADTGGRAANPSDHGADHRAPARSHGVLPAGRRLPRLRCASTASPASGAVASRPDEPESAEAD
jgi:hypothetical protein